MQIAGKCIQNLIVNMMLKKKLRHKSEKTTFHIFALGNELNKFQFEIVQCVITYET